MIAISDNIQLRKDAPSGSIIINRPNRRNALSREIIDSIRQALEDFYQESNVRAIILTGVGNTFCSGTDLREVRDSMAEKNAMEIWHQDALRFQELIEYMLRYPKPIIAAVNGWVLGSGVGLMLAADIVIGSESAQLRMPEAKLGLNTGLTTPLMAFRIGTGPTSDLLISGRTLSSTAAQELGLFHEIVSDDLVWARSQQLAIDCAQGAPHSHLLTKQLLNETVGEPLFTQLSIGSANSASARTTDAAIEGVNAFLEKRKPDWVN
ncbi:MAG: enoyl-CoA hydratase/isomerase family protein [Mariniblastus sp.]|nr:enoyl-CoA hydratase/isomerase family protein [Mariniblastus sp.]